MRRWLKWMLAGGVVCCLAGAGVITAGTVMGGSLVPRHSLRHGIETGRSRWAEQISQDAQKIAGEPSEATEVTEATEKIGQWPSAGTDEAPLISADAYEGVRMLVLELNCNAVELREDEALTGNTVMVGRGQTSGAAYLIRQDGARLKLEPDSDHGQETALEPLIIFIPQGYTFDEVEVENHMGDFQAEMLQAGKLSLDCDGGAITIGDGSVRNLEVDCSAGNVECLAVADTRLEVECRAGAVTVMLDGVWEDYDYALEWDVGQILLNGEEPREFSGLHRKQRLDHHTGREAEVDCSAGSVTVNFSGPVV